ncbi:MAG: class I SAM-dependent methyltransferase [Planctomycetaceae bacterium]
MLTRILEPEVMDTVQEAEDYDAMDHSAVNRQFVADVLEQLSRLGRVNQNCYSVLDAGTGTAQIPIEFCRQSAGAKITAIDLAGEMLRLAKRNVDRAGLSERIQLECVDSKKLPYDDATFDVVISNSIIHHIPKPKVVFAELSRVVKPGGLLFIRDLLRPDDEATLSQLVERYAGNENAHQRQMFCDSLHAALTVDEVCKILNELGISEESVCQTTDRHWTLATQKAGRSGSEYNDSSDD